MEFPTGRRAGTEVCEILGLDPNKTAELSIHFYADKAVQIDALIYPDVEDWERIKDVMITVTRTYRRVDEPES